MLVRWTVTGAGIWAFSATAVYPSLRYGDFMVYPNLSILLHHCFAFAQLLLIYQ